jgi:hypothetical protein
MWWMPLAMMAAGGAKHALVDAPTEEAQTKLRAEEIRMSPWTRQTEFTKPKDASLANSLIQGGMSGLLMQNMETHDMAKKINQGYLDAAQSGRASWRPAAMMTPQGTPVFSPWSRPMTGENFYGMGL